MKSQMFENIKAFLAVSTVASNSLIQWLSDADTFLKLIATAIAIPTGFFAAKFMYLQGKYKKLEIQELEKRINGK